MADKVRADKAAAVAELAEQFRSSTATVLTEYRGLTVGQIIDLRRQLSPGGRCQVAKNTLARRAAQVAGAPGMGDLFGGPTALVFVTGDPTAAARVLRDFTRTHPALVIKGGVV